MADEEREGDDEEIFVEKKYIYSHLDVSVHLIGKADPIFARMKVRFSTDDLPETIEQLTDSYATIVLRALDSRSTHNMTLSGDAGEKLIVELAEVQSIMVHPPDKMPPELVKEEDE